MEIVENTPGTTLYHPERRSAAEGTVAPCAAQHGQSMEAELRQILRETLDAGHAPELNLAEAIRRRMALLGEVDLEPHPPMVIGEPPSFEP